MHWFSLNCNTVAGKLHDLVSQLIQQRFCRCLHIAAQAEGDSVGIKLGYILESRKIFSCTGIPKRMQIMYRVLCAATSCKMNR